MLKELNRSRIKYIAIHHFGGTIANRWFKTQNLTLERIENGFSSRWDFPSKLNGSNIGYNVIVWPDGSYTQHRYVGEETAAQIGFNHNTISICVAGNFSLQTPPSSFSEPRYGNPVETPTEKQVATLRRLLIYSYDRFNVPLSRVKAHRTFPHAHTECYGTALSDNWGRNLLKPHVQKRLKNLKILLNLYIKLLSLLEKVKPHTFGGFGRKCEGYI